MDCCKLSSIVILTVLLISALPHIGSETVAHQSSGVSTRIDSSDHWPAFRSDETNNGFSTSKGPVNDTVAWKYNMADSAYSSPIVVDEKIYVNSKEGTTHCLWLTNGTGIWTYSIGRGTYSSTVYSDGFLYFGDHGGYVHCIWASNGTRKWRVRPDTSTLESSPQVFGGWVYIGSKSGHFYSLNKTTGAQDWDKDLGASMSSTACIGDGKVFIFTYAHELWAYWLSNGTEAWKKTIAAQASQTEYVSPIYDNGVVFIACVDLELHAYYTSNGTEKWATWFGETCGSPVIGYNRVYIGSYEEKIHCFDLDDGDLIWEYKAPTQIWCSPVIADEKVYFATSDSKMYCINAMNKSLEWSNLSPAQQDDQGSSPCLVSGICVVGMGDNKLWAFGEVDNRDTDLPTVVDHSPVADQTGVGENVNITITFSELMNTSSLDSGVKLLDESFGDVPVVISHLGVVTTLDPVDALEYDTTYTVVVSGNVRDVSGNTLDGDGDEVDEGSPLDDHTFSFSVVTKFGPQITGIPVQYPTEETDLWLNLTGYISDPDNEIMELNVTENSTYAELYENLSLKMNYPEGVLDDHVNITVSDGLFTVWTTINVVVVPVDDPPEVDEIPGLLLDEDVEFVLDLSGNITDIDTPLEDIRLKVDSLNVEIDNLTLTFLYTEGQLYEDVLVTIDDGTTEVDRLVNVTIKPVNDPPVFKFLPDITCQEGFEKTVDLSKYIKDIDTPDAELVLTQSSKYGSVVGHTIMFLYDGVLESEEVDVTLSDGEFSVMRTLNVSVVLRPENLRPEVYEGMVDPGTGDSETTFVFTVRYQDEDAYTYSGRPINTTKYCNVSLHLKNQTTGNTEEFEMAPQVGDISSGALFQKKFDRLDAGDYEFWFSGDDLTGEENAVNLTGKLDLSVVPVEPDPVVDDDDIEPPVNTTDDDDSAATGFWAYYPMFVLLAILLLAIVIVIMIIVVLRSKKKKPEPKKLTNPDLTWDDPEIETSPINTDSLEWEDDLSEEELPMDEMEGGLPEEGSLEDDFIPADIDENGNLEQVEEGFPEETEESLDADADPEETEESLDEEVDP